MNKSKVLAIILGGGKGTRLYPLTKHRAKPAVPFGGKFRIIDIPISNCLNSGIKKIYILTQFNTQSLHRHIYGTYRLGRFSEGFVDILAAQQTTENMDWYQGTADAVRQNLSFISQADADYILILSGDHLYRMNYGEFLDTHIKSEAQVTISVKPVKPKEASSFGILQTDQNNHVVKFVEKPHGKLLKGVQSPGLPSKTPYLASMGIYIFNTTTLHDILHSDPQEDFGRHIIPSNIESGKIVVHHFKDYWQDIGSIESFFNANLELTSLTPPFTFYDEKAPIYTRARSLPGSRLEDCRVDRVLLSDGCFIKNARIDTSVIGIRTIISSGTEIQNCVIMGADFYESSPPQNIPKIGIGKNGRLKNTIIDKNARIGQNVQILNRDHQEVADGKNYHIRDGIVVIPKNAVVEDNTII